MANDVTTIKVKKTTKAVMDELCKKTESYDDFMNRLIEAYNT